VLVVIGILIALQINNWNDQRLKQNLGKEILMEIKTELVSDLEDVVLNLNLETIRLASADILIEWIERDLPYNEFSWNSF
jgi:sensor domain CHASE-containing protein